VQGNYISYDATTELFQVTGGATQSAGTKPADSRVRAIFQPKKDGGDAGAGSK
jgi:hypothetical protein